ncbi:sigma-70 family RNA polymerase sigma factor [Compostibacter hankyongensis]|uniref:RNA polymerase sigma factor n=1 Tax=Compostibacter hankyongensis TaxID=1007089 RepID=A0ABP8FBB1_9BACT
MSGNKEAVFLKQLNQNLGIAYKACRVYFHDEEVRKDAMQEMIYQLWRSFDSYGGKSKFSTWMYSVCINTAIKYKKTIAGKEKVETLSRDHLEVSTHVPDQPVQDREEAVNALYKAISTLSSLNKAIVLLYLEEMTYEEIAAIVGISKSNVSVRLVRIKRALEVKLKNDKNL